MALVMSFCMSLTMTLVNVGLSDLFPVIWLRGWAIGFCVAFPISLILPKHIQKLSAKLLKSKN